MRPSRPLPTTVARSMPDSRARRRVAGDASTRPRARRSRRGRCRRCTRGRRNERQVAASGGVLRRSGRGFASSPAARRSAFAGLQHDELGADGDVIARLAAERHDAARDGRGHLDHGLVGRHLDHRLVFGDAVADLDVPRDDLRGDRAFAEVRQLHDMAAHFASIVAFSAAATRAWPGKYSHSNACGYGVSQPATRWIGASRCQKHSSWIDREDLRAEAREARRLVRDHAAPGLLHRVARSSPHRAARSCGCRSPRRRCRATPPRRCTRAPSCRR